jgi:hypothetical protein
MEMIKRIKYFGRKMSKDVGRPSSTIKLKWILEEETMKVWVESK